MTGPIRRGARLGTATVSSTACGRGVAAPRRPGIPEASAFDKARGFVEEHPIPLAIAVCAILVVASSGGPSAERDRERRVGVSQMILTVTLNAAIDRTVAVPNFRLGRRHRAVEWRTVAGGKGINVARALACSASR